MHSLTVRALHWLNVPLLAVMWWSGLRIYNANDVHAIDVLGLRFEFFPQPVYDALDADHRLARGIGHHLTFGWLFTLVGLAYVAHLARRGRWRRLVPDRRALASIPAVVAHELGLRAEAPELQGYNPAQQLAYTLAVAWGAVMVVTGLAIYKPVQLRPLVVLLGGYETARLIHFTTALLLVVFVAVHLVQVARAGWSNFASMVNGYRLDPAPGRHGRGSGGGGGPEEAAPPLPAEVDASLEPAP